MKEGLSGTPSHDCLTALIFSHEIDGVRKEKERLTAVSLLFLWRLTNQMLLARAKERPSTNARA